MSAKARQAVLEAAISITTSARNTSYGEAEDNFRVIAAFNRVYYEAVYRYRQEPCPEIDVAIQNILQKISRIITSPLKADHWIDIAGYAGCGGGIAADLEQRQDAADLPAPSDSASNYRLQRQSQLDPVRSPIPNEP